MLRMIAVSALLLSVSAPVVAAPPKPAANDMKQIACVPLRDKAGHPTRQMVCRTAEQWAALLRKNGYERRVVFDYPRTEAFLDPAQYLPTLPPRAK